MPKTVQLPIGLFLKLVRYFVFEDKDLYDDCRSGIVEKMDKMEARLRYSKEVNHDRHDRGRDQN